MATNAQMPMVGVDIGGTFTDVVLMDPASGPSVVKVPSVAGDYVAGLINGVEQLSIEPSEIGLLVHGTTIATNAIISRTGADVAVITNLGFRDVLLLRRSDRADQFNLWWQAAEPLVRRRDILEVPGRIDFRGDVLQEFDEEQARAVAREIRRRGKQAVAIVFLHSFVNPEMEARMKRILLEEHPGCYVSTSSEILPEILEYERTATTLANAYVGPLTSAYLAQLIDRCAEKGYRGDVLICSSSGGVMGPDLASVAPARTMASGPAAGVVAATAVGAQLAIDDLITFDMGGTSLDIALVRDGEIQRRPEWLTPDGTPIRFASVDVTSIGAGGGSIAWVDPGGSLRIGPRSAGSKPGPACYGVGGVRPTCTDAQVVLGRLGGDSVLAGSMPLHPELAADAIERDIVAPLSLGDAVEGAAAILRVTVHNMAEALRLLTVYRGLDPREFALVSYGGAGPMFAVAVAREAGIRRVVVPRTPGLLCALGLLLMDIRHDHAQSILTPLGDLSERQLADIYAGLRERADAALAREQVPVDARTFVLEADLRYFGTTHTLTIPVEVGASDIRAHLERVFVEEHEREYGYTIGPEVAPIEIATARVVGLGALERPGLEAFAPTGDGVTAQPVLTRTAWFDGEFVEAPVYRRDDLAVGQTLSGPAIVEQLDTTIVLDPGATLSVDVSGSLIVEIS